MQMTHVGPNAFEFDNRMNNAVNFIHFLLQRAHRDGFDLVASGKSLL